MTNNERAHENSRSTVYNYNRLEKRMAKTIEFSFFLSTDRVKYTYPRRVLFARQVWNKVLLWAASNLN